MPRIPRPAPKSARRVFAPGLLQHQCWTVTTKCFTATVLLCYSHGSMEAIDQLIDQCRILRQGRITIGYRQPRFTIQYCRNYNSVLVNKPRCAGKTRSGLASSVRVGGRWVGSGQRGLVCGIQNQYLCVARPGGVFRWGLYEYNTWLLSCTGKRRMSVTYSRRRLPHPRAPSRFFSPIKKATPFRHLLVQRSR